MSDSNILRSNTYYQKNEERYQYIIRKQMKYGFYFPIGIIIFLGALCTIICVSIGKPCNYNTSFMCFGYERFAGTSFNASIEISQCNACIEGHITKNNNYICDHQILYPCYIVTSQFINPDNHICSYKIGTYDYLDEANLISKSYNIGIFKKLLKPLDSNICENTKQKFINWQKRISTIIIVGIIITFYLYRLINYLLSKIIDNHYYVSDEITIHQLSIIIKTHNDMIKKQRCDIESNHNSEINLNRIHTARNNRSYHQVSDDDDCSMVPIPPKKLPIAKAIVPSAPPIFVDAFVL